MKAAARPPGRGLRPASYEEVRVRIPAERPAGLLRLLYHRPPPEERRLIAQEADLLEAYHARPAAESLRRAQAAADDHRSYLANVWMPRHPFRAAIESLLQAHADRRAGTKRARPGAATAVRASRGTRYRTTTNAFNETTRTAAQVTAITASNVRLHTTEWAKRWRQSGSIVGRPFKELTGHPKASRRNAKQAADEHPQADVPADA